VHILLCSITKHGPPQAILVSDWPIFKNLLLWNCLVKLTETWQEASMECPLWRLLISSRSVNKRGPPQAILVSDWPIFKNLLWNCLVKLTETWQEAYMECPLWRLFISSRSVNKHGHHRQFLFLIGQHLKSLLLWNCLAKWTETW
jgi:hypothetical protein